MRFAELTDAVYLLYLLDWYERANTDWYERTNTGRCLAKLADPSIPLKKKCPSKKNDRWLLKLADPSIPLDELRKVLSLLVLLVQKRQY